MGRFAAASNKVLLASVMTALLAAGQVACTTQGTPGAKSVASEPDAEQTVDDNVIKLELNRRLIDDGLGLFKDVSIVVYNGRVLLIGSVDQPESLERAAKLAADTVGVQDVINEIQVNDKSGIGAFISDVIIEKSIQSEYLFEDGIKSANFRVRAVNGVVYIIGRAESQIEYDRVAAVASQTADVKRVVNYVVLAPK